VRPYESTWLQNCPNLKYTSHKQGEIVSKIDIIVSGHLCVDLIPDMVSVTTEALTIPGRLNEVGPLGISTGGTVSNTGLALHKLGVDVRFMATVGDDVLGKMIIDLLETRDKALVEMISVQAGQPTSYTVVLSPELADRTFLHCTGTNDTFGVVNIDFDLMEQARIFHLGYPPLLPRMMLDDGAELAEIYRRAKATGVVTSLDMAMPDPDGISGQANWQKIVADSMPYVDVFLPSIDEILFMLRREDYERWGSAVLENITADYLADLADEIIDLGAVVVGFKLGTMGIYLQTAAASKFDRLERLNLDVDQWAAVKLWKPAFQVAVSVTVGAGDTAYAGFLAALVKGLSPQDALRWAAAVSAHSVEGFDANSGIRTWAEIEARLASDWAARPERLTGYTE
jgi:sugar/nucleoside kinase (ribokinase family)